MEKGKGSQEEGEQEGLLLLSPHPLPFHSGCLSPVCLCVWVLLPFPFLFPLWKVMAIIKLLRCRNGGFCCVLLLLWEQNTFTVWSLQNVFWRSRFQVESIFYPFQFLTYVNCRREAWLLVLKRSCEVAWTHNGSKVILLMKRRWIKFPLKSVTENAGCRWKWGSIWGLLPSNTRCKSLLNV